MTINFKAFVLTFLSLVLAVSISCGPFIPEFPEGIMDAMRPIYADSLSFHIQKEDARPIQNMGQIFQYQDYLMIYELGQGVHVIDNSDKENPNMLFFLTIAGSSDIAVEGDLIFTNSFADLITMKLDGDELVIIDRNENFYRVPGQEKYPPGEDIYYECVDETRGRVIGWVPALLNSPECYKR